MRSARTPLGARAIMKKIILMSLASVLMSIGINYEQIMNAPLTYSKHEHRVSNIWNKNRHIAQRQKPAFFTYRIRNGILNKVFKDGNPEER